ncbi:PREDICTED: uncharacterized protein LOC108569977 [Nicrophorus vespilloides]|uniref:Uncharacterized protein LOC108569977 n=1 Tax=Nicrophorus vespilloides TaxID=110193 RepID=A0ABM1NKB4_NICVS|nr:PREDICTED: uncharacterized protein LOC108569977 [Nicrophorus vespilloides]
MGETHSGGDMDSTELVNKNPNSNRETINFFNDQDSGPFIVNVEPTDPTTNSTNSISLGYKLSLSIKNRINKVESRGRNRVAVFFKTKNYANEFLTSDFLVNNKLKAYIPSHIISCKGIIRDIDRTILEDDIQKNMICSDSREILRAERINRRSHNEAGETVYVPTNSLIITFRGKQPPESVSIYLNFRRPETYVPRVIQCFGCLRYGHTKKICKSKLVRCPACSENHQIESCPSKDDPTCAYCEGKHLTNEANVRLSERRCPEYLKQKQIKEAMVRHNYSFFEARDHLYPTQPSFEWEKEFPRHNTYQEDPLPLRPSVFTKNTYASTLVSPPKTNKTKIISVPAHKYRTSEHSYAKTSPSPKRKKPRTRKSPDLEYRPPKPLLKNEDPPITTDEEADDAAIAFLQKLALSASQGRFGTNSRITAAIQEIIRLLRDPKAYQNGSETNSS